MKHYTKKELADRLSKAVNKYQGKSIDKSGPVMNYKVKYTPTNKTDRVSKLKLIVDCKKKPFGIGTRRIADNIFENYYYDALLGQLELDSGCFFEQESVSVLDKESVKYVFDVRLRPKDSYNPFYFS